MTMALKPGLAFSLACDPGFAVGLMTHYLERIGHLVWMAEPIFEEEPTVADVMRIHDWRWPIFFPLDAAVRRKIVIPIGVVPIPDALRPFPVMRSGSKRMGWMAFTETDGVRQRLGRTNDPRLPIFSVVNDTWLKEKVVAGWKPELEW